MTLYPPSSRYSTLEPVASVLVPTRPMKMFTKKTHIYFTCCCDALDYEHSTRTVRHFKREDSTHLATEDVDSRNYRRPCTVIRTTTTVPQDTCAVVPSVRHSVSPYIFLRLSLSLITVALMHSTLQPCSRNQCDTARLESKLTRWFKTCSSHPMRMNTRF